ncbi:MAG TPA: hypothetical protein DCX22_03980 [Dehalococcoidia bacterium]|nr:hypothetical protein [Dehalococcoidia bacterium]
MINCTSCGTQNEASHRFCTTCGSRLGSLCRSCGNLVPPDSRFCPHCAALVGPGRFGKMQHKVEGIQAEILCASCGAKGTVGQRFCTVCGKQIGTPCHMCGSAVDPVTDRCLRCGHINVQNTGI